MRDRLLSETVSIRRTGKRWRIQIGPREVVVDDVRGLAYLAVLTANPRREIAAAELAARSPVARETPSAQPVLDDVAQRQYRRRLADLQEQIDTLEERGDLVRADGVRSEREWLIAELAAAAGLGGRARAFVDNAERARVAVGKAIRRAIDRVAAADPVIGGQLRETVATGNRCCYHPL